MRIQDIEVGKTYRLSSAKDHYGNYVGYVKVLEIFKANSYNNPSPKKVSCVKCEHTYCKGDTVGFIRYFRPMELVKESEE